jgi:hypothetical protein
MAEIVRIEGQEFKRRSPLGVWGLTIITVGIYGFVWYYKINDEARRYLRDDAIRPGIAVLAIILGWLIIVPPFVSIYRTGQRIQRMQDNARVTQRTEPVLGLIAFLVYSLHIPYYQSGLNKVWAAYGAVEPGAAEAPPPLPPPPAEATE